MVQCFYRQVPFLHSDSVMMLSQEHVHTLDVHTLDVHTLDEHTLDVHTLDEHTLDEHTVST